MHKIFRIFTYIGSIIIKSAKINNYRLSKKLNENLIISGKLTCMVYYQSLHTDTN